VGEGRTIESARQAMVLTFFHWGLHAWAIYIVVGLALAYFAFRRGLPLTLRSGLFPLIGQRIHGPIGHAIDIFAVLGTMFGVATSLGFGVLQVNAGFSYLFGLPVSPTVKIVLIAAITGMATLSAATGLDKGVKRLSELNIILAIALLLFVLAVGSTVFLLQAFVQNIGAYLGAVVQRTFRMYAYEPNAWLGDWTLFYWGWWISWSPFVGMFIARVSRGRTVREFLLAVLLVPSILCVLWMTAMGGTAISQVLNDGFTGAQEAALELKLFAMLTQLPLTFLTSLIGIVLVVVFFVTSADSGSLVIDTIAAGGKVNSPTPQRVFWATFGGLVAIALLLGGGLAGLQAMAVSTGFPFTFVLLGACYAILRGLMSEPR
jgi:choline/glycine/proline betaine transport protein